MERKIESAELRMEKGETCRSGVFVKSVCEVRVRVRLGGTATVTISESFETTELGEAWRDGVVRGVDVAAPLWAQLDRDRALATASAIDVAEKARREERERIAKLIEDEASAHIANGHQYDIDALKDGTNEALPRLRNESLRIAYALGDLANALRKDGAT